MLHTRSILVILLVVSCLVVKGKKVDIDAMEDKLKTMSPEAQEAARNFKKEVLALIDRAMNSVPDSVKKELETLLPK